MLPKEPLCGGFVDLEVDHEDVLPLIKVVLNKLSENDENEKTLVEVLSASRQIVSGTLTKLTMKISDGGKHRKCQAKIWEQPWLNRTEITELKFLEED